MSTKITHKTQKPPKSAVFVFYLIDKLSIMAVIFLGFVE